MEKKSPPSKESFLEPIRKGVSKDLTKDLYFYFMEASWSQVIFFMFLSYILLNTFFALTYMIQPYTIKGIEQAGFLDAFAFSVQTMSTIGFGALSPGNIYGDFIVTVEAGVSIIAIAVITGFIVAKTSRPKSKIMFTNNAVINFFNGKKTLYFRIGNARGNDVVDAKVAITAYFNLTTDEGEHFRKLEDLKLVRTNSPFFKATWTIMHILDEDSPIIKNESAFNGFFVTVTGHDSTYSNTIYSRHFYHKTDILEGANFADIISHTDDGIIVIDFERFQDIRE